MRAVCSLVLVACAACERPSPLVICHNANCASPDASRDDTPGALAESFALSFEGRPVIDGMELDTFWDGAGSRCLFAHELGHSDSIPALEAADLVAQHLEDNAVVSWNGERFYAFLELKGYVGESYDDRHTAAQFVEHATCALDAARLIADGARRGGHEVTIGFIAGVPRHHATLVEQDAWDVLEAEPHVELILIGDIFAPYASIVPELSDFTVPLDVAEYHPDYMTAQHRETYRSLGIELAQWSFVSTTEAFAAIQRYEPKFAISNEALLLRRWIEN